MTARRFALRPIETAGPPGAEVADWQCFGPRHEAPPPPPPAPEPEPEPEPVAEPPAPPPPDPMPAIAGALEALAAELEAHRARIEAEVSGAMAEAAAGLLPEIARAGFAETLTETLQAIARRTRPGPLVLWLAEADRDRVALALDAVETLPPLGLQTDPGLLPGTARLGWPDGGADLDAGRMAAAALAQFRSRLPHRTPADMPEEACA